MINRAEELEKEWGLGSSQERWADVNKKMGSKKKN